jgi:dihydrodipicolinate synthase/N-acetylneuraminate lyase
MEMREVDYDQFLIDCCEAVPDIAIIHYNIARTKKLYFADDYLRVMSKAPTMIGTKAAMPFNNFIELMSRAPQLNHFVGETYFPLAHQLGCKGMYTSWTMMNPDFFKAYYQMCVDGRYAEAIEIMMRFNRWHAEAVRPLIQKGYLDPALDKPFVEMSGWLPGRRRLRKPYNTLSDDEMAELRRKTEEIMPEFLAYRP